MAALTWTPQATYRHGVSHGVFYPETGPGVPWNGLTGIADAGRASGSDEAYVDGTKYLSTAKPVSEKLKLTCYTLPEGFDAARGYASAIPGIRATGQPRKPFAMAYRNAVGTDDYRLHLLYGVLATPETHSMATATESFSPVVFTYTLDLTPQRFTDLAPTGHVVVDSRHADPVDLQVLENVLYGTVGTEPQMPSASTLEALLSSWGQA